MYPLQAVLLIFLVHSVSSLVMATTDTTARKVLVTGAGGKTGRLVMQKLLLKPLLAPVGVVRTATSKEGLVKEGIPESQIVIADICDSAAMQKACEGMDALIVCTSATPAPTGDTTPEGRPVF